MGNKAITFIKQEIVFILSFFLAVISCFFVIPSKEYLTYIDYRVLALLFCLMAVVQGFSSMGVFHKLGKSLLQKLSSTRNLALALICLCFFSSMLITNDVALITFVPFTIFILQLANRTDQLIVFIVLETISANLGSMLTPLGNPQNLYLYTVSEMKLGTFLMTLLPYSVVAFVLLILCTFLIKKEPISIQSVSPEPESISAKEAQPKSKHNFLLVVYSLLFLLCLLVVLHILPFLAVFMIVGVTILVFDRTVLKQVDYFLLLTFVCFFIFIGNLKNIPAVHQVLSQVIYGHEFLSGVLTSQIISNVPAALLLSGFTDEWSALLVGVNIGGLGTLIASLASLISYKQYIKTADSKTSRYLLIFTLYSIGFLAILVPLYFLLN